MSNLIERLGNAFLEYEIPSRVAELIDEAAYEIKRQSNNAAILAQQVADLTAELQREHEDHKQANEDAAMYMSDAERWRMFLSTRPPETHEAICSAIDAAKKPDA